MRSASYGLASVVLPACLVACLAAGLALGACAQGETDSTDALFDQNVPVVDSGVPVHDSGPHDYGSHDTGTTPPPTGNDDSGGGNPVVDSGGGNPGDDSGGGVVDSGGGSFIDTAPPPTGHGVCGSNIKYALEYALLSVLTDCTDGSECASTQCCYVNIVQSACVPF